MLLRIIHKINNRKYAIVVPLIVLSVILVIVGWKFIPNESADKGVITKSVEESDWNTYTSKEYSFEISFPRDWRVHEEFKNTSPIINIYKPEFDKKPPFDHFSDVNSISIFPRGVDTEVLIGETAQFESEVVMNESVDVDGITDYILESGVVWARYITFNSVPENWRPWGSVWSRSRIKGLEFSCDSGGEIIPIENCNPFGGDVFVRTGSLDPAIIEIQKEILESFKFI